MVQLTAAHAKTPSIKYAAVADHDHQSPLATAGLPNIYTPCIVLLSKDFSRCSLFERAFLYGTVSHAKTLLWWKSASKIIVFWTSLSRLLLRAGIFFYPAPLLRMTAKTPDFPFLPGLDRAQKCNGFWPDKPDPPDSLEIRGRGSPSTFLLSLEKIPFWSSELKRPKDNI